MGAMYVVTFSSVAVTAQQDFFEIPAPSTRLLIIHSVELTQSTDVGDAASEGLAILHKRGIGSTTGSGGTTGITATKLETGSATSLVTTAKTNDTTKMSAGTISTLHSSNWIIQQPYLYLPTPETRHIIAPSEKYTVELATTPADSITMSGTITFEEIG
jgi:hypothetical protein